MMVSAQSGQFPLVIHRELPRRASSSLTFLRLKVGFLRDSGYTQSPLTLTHRAQAGVLRSHFSFLDRQETQASASVPAFAPSPVPISPSLGSCSISQAQERAR